MEEMWGTGFAGSSPPFFGRERAAVDVDVGPERREKVGFTKNTARRHRRVGRRAVTVTAMLHRQRYRGIEKEKEKAR